MAALSLLPPFPRLSRRRQTLPFPPKIHPTHSFFPPCNPLKLPLSTVLGAKPGESQFLDEDGAVDDMDGYLNYLSLEYDSVWDTKPSWCQPWTILLTGVGAVASSWLFLHSIIISGGIFFIICLWWYLFLYLYPKAYSDMIAERRKKVSTGVEDTFGLKKKSQ